MNKFSIVLLSIFFWAVSTGCNKDGVGIFYSIEKETETVNNNLPDEISVSGFAESESEDRYYVSGGQVYSTQASDFTPGYSPWDMINPPPAATEENIYQAVDMAYFNDGLYACYASVDGSSYGAYVREGNAWTPLSSISSIVDSKNNIGVGAKGVGLMSAGDYLVLIVDDQNTDSPKYDLYFSDDGVNFVMGVNDYPYLSDMAYDRGNDVYWVISRNMLLYASGTDLSAGTGFTKAASYPATSGFTGIHYSEALSSLFLATMEGAVYESDGSAWTSIASLGVELGDFSDYYNDATHIVVLVGAEEGYYEKEFDTTDSTKNTAFQEPELSTSENYLSLDIKTSVVRGFYSSPDTGVFDNQAIIFAMTAGYGLWSNILNTDTAVREWNSE